MTQKRIYSPVEAASRVRSEEPSILYANPFVATASRDELTVLGKGTPRTVNIRVLEWLTDEFKCDG
jgi:hypothetical protein